MALVLCRDFTSSCVKGKKLGQGTYGEVFVYDTPKGKCAVKHIKMTESMPRDFVREVDVLHKFINHDHFVRMIGIETNVEKHSVKIFMELMSMDSSTLSAKHHLSSQERISCVVRLIKHVGSALASLNHHGIIHNDIKSNNVLALKTRDGYVFKLADFGKARKIKKNDTNHGSLARYKPPGKDHNALYCEYWAFMIVVCDMLQGKFVRGGRFATKEAARKTIEGMNPPQIFWDFFNPIFKSSDTTILDGLQNIPVKLDKRIVNTLVPGMNDVDTLLKEFIRKNRNISSDGVLKFKNVAECILLDAKPMHPKLQDRIHRLKCFEVFLRDIGYQVMIV